jgi:SAM-dependent methyltransferase
MNWNCVEHKELQLLLIFAVAFGKLTKLKNVRFPISGFDKTREELVRNFAEQSLVGKTILELGCGSGERTRLFYDMSQVIGVDIMREIDEGRKRKFNFLLADATILPFRNDSFDAVVSFDVVEHVVNDETFVAEAFRVCKRRGKIIIGTPNRLRLSNRVRRLLGKQIIYPRQMGPGVIHLREYSSEQFVSLVSSGGFLGICICVWLGLVSRLDKGLKIFPAFLNPLVQYLIFFGYKP